MNSITSLKVKNKTKQKSLGNFGNQFAETAAGCKKYTILSCSTLNDKLNPL